MTTSEFKDCLEKYYQTEVFGEGFFGRAMIKFSEPEHRYKVACLLQLETETKARLRPAILELSGSIVEDEESRQTGRELADSISTGNWSEFVSELCDVGEPLLQSQRETAVSAPETYRELAESMAIHGEAIQYFAESEVAGEGENSIDGVVAQLKFPLPPPP
jgi:hypothetical protein